MLRARVLLLFLPLLCQPAAAQYAATGISVPITLSGEAMDTQRPRLNYPGTNNWAAAFRAVFYPTLKLGSGWFAYSAFEVSSRPYFYYESYDNAGNVDTRVLQAFLGYTRTTDNKAVSVKVGELTTAFGSFPLRYDDAVNPLLDVPLSYGTQIKIRPDQLPCGVADLRGQRWFDDVSFSCGGATTENYGLWPATVWGLPGAEVDFSAHRLDARFQLTNSSPANPQVLTSGSQHVQWTAGGGYTIRQGFRVGFSAYRGPFLENSVSALLPPGKNSRDYPATGIGVDGKWARGRWSANGEFAWFQFQYPGFVTSPAVSTGYLETKAIITPRFYAAFRASALGYNRVEDLQTRSTTTFQPNQQAYEFAFGIHVNHFQLVKLGYEFLKTSGVAGSGSNVLGVQFVTSIDALAKAIK